MVRETERALPFEDKKKKIEDASILTGSIDDRASERGIGRVITIRIKLCHLLEAGPIGVDHAELIVIAARTGKDQVSNMFLGRPGRRRETWQSSGQ